MTSALAGYGGAGGAGIAPAGGAYPGWAPPEGGALAGGTDGGALAGGGTLAVRPVPLLGPPRPLPADFAGEGAER